MAAGINWTGATGVVDVRGDSHPDKLDVSADLAANTATFKLSQYLFNPIQNKSSWQTKQISSLPLNALTRIEFRGYEGNDLLINSTNIPSLAYGGAGNDSLEGGSGSDTLWGEAGLDSLQGNGGNDVLYGTGIYLPGGSGVDGPNQIMGGEGNDEIQGGAFGDTLEGNGGNDKIYGHGGADTVFGGSGHDLLKGGTGDDELHGGEGNDHIWGDEGVDQLFGEAGMDSLYGGAGNDSLLGGTGSDQLVAIGGGLDFLRGGDPAQGWAEDLAPDSFWADLTDGIYSPEANEIQQGEIRRIHRVTEFASYSYDGGFTTIPVSKELNGDKLLDPIATDATFTRVNFQGKELFGNQGPKMTDIDQGSVGDCYFMAALAAIANANPAFIRELVVDLGDGTYGVQFHDAAGANVFIRVDADLWTDNGVLAYAQFGSQGTLWVPILEKAFAFVAKSDGSYASISGGLTPDLTVPQLLGLPFTYLHAIPANYVNVTTYLLSIKKALEDGHAVVFGAPVQFSNMTAMSEKNNRSSAHIYAVKSVLTDPNGDPIGIELYDPWGVTRTVTDLDRIWWCSGGAGSYAV